MQAGKWEGKPHDVYYFLLLDGIMGGKLGLYIGSSYRHVFHNCYLHYLCCFPLSFCTWRTCYTSLFVPST